MCNWRTHYYLSRISLAGVSYLSCIHRLFLMTKNNFDDVWHTDQSKLPKRLLFVFHCSSPGWVDTNAIWIFAKRSIRSNVHLKCSASTFTRELMHDIAFFVKKNIAALTLISGNVHQMLITSLSFRLVQSHIFEEHYCNCKKTSLWIFILGKNTIQQHICEHRVLQIKRIIKILNSASKHLQGNRSLVAIFRKLCMKERDRYLCMRSSVLWYKLYELTSAYSFPSSCIFK